MLKIGLTAIIVFLLSTWLRPIWSDAMKTDFTMPIPPQYARRTPSGITFRALQAFFWSEPSKGFYWAARIDSTRNMARRTALGRHVAVHRVSVLPFAPFPRTSALLSKIYQRDVAASVVTCGVFSIVMVVVFYGVTFWSLKISGQMLTGMFEVFTLSAMASGIFISFTMFFTRRLGWIS